MRTKILILAFVILSAAADSFLIHNCFGQWQPDVRLTNDPASSYTSTNNAWCVASSGNVVHVVWYDNRDGNNEIYYKRNPAGNHIDFLRNGLNKSILDNQNTYDTITVVNDFLSGYVADVNLRIDTVLYASDADLEFTLIHQGISDTTVYQVGGSGDNFIGTVLDDDASVNISSGTAPFTGTFRPTKPLSQFHNSNPAGLWILRIYDRATGNTGTLKAWGITLLISGTPAGIQNKSNQIPESYSLMQNYPNPFNPSTLISYQLPVSGYVTLKVYDLLGNEIATLVDEYKPAGIYNVEFRMQNLELSSGIYFYQLTAGDFIQTKKMVLLR